MAEEQTKVTDFRLNADELRELAEIAEILGGPPPESLALQFIRDLRALQNKTPPTPTPAVAVEPPRSTPDMTAPD